MSFNFFNPDKISALRAAGFQGVDLPADQTCSDISCCGQGCCCFCSPANPAGVTFDPPVGISSKAHDRAIKAVLTR